MENKKFSFRGKVRLISYITAIIITLAIFATVQSVKAVRYRREAQLTKQMALISLDEYLDNISTGLEKTIYVNSPTMLSQLSTELWRESSGAKNSLLMLPTSDNVIDGTYKFLSQVGEFVMALGRKSATGEEITEDERQQLKTLYEYSGNLRDQISRMCYDMQNGDFYFDKYETTLLDQKTDVSTLSKSFDDVEQSFSDFPSLIYDGPFSDHIENQSPKFLEGLKEITKNEANEIAVKVCEHEKDSLKFAYEEAGSLPCYVFQSDNCTVAITKNGGKPLYMINSKFAGEVQIQYDAAVSAAKKYLAQIGYDNLKESYYFTEDGICTVNFAAYENSIVIYPDLIKVSVSLENGQVTSFDATGYISNHQIRNYNTNSLSESEAVSKINSHLNIIDVQKCIIPTQWKSEKLCYEVHCATDNNQELLIYVDAKTGEEDDILILMYSDGGVLTK